MDKKTLSKLAALVAISLVFGFSLKMVLDIPSMAKNKKNSQALNSLSSSVIPYALAYGQISKIESRTLTLDSSNSSIKINIIKDAQIYSYSGSNASDKTPSQALVPFETLKTGNMVSVNFHVLKNADFEGTSVVIINMAEQK